MVKKVRWNYELVNEFVNSNSECNLISTEFKTVKDKLLFKCECGEEFEATFEKFKGSNKRQCNKCGNKIMNSKQSLNFSDVLDFVMKNSDCELLETEFINTKTKMKFKCHCGDYFHKSFEKFKSKEKQCKNCSYLDISKSQTFPFEYVKEYIEMNECVLISNEYDNCYSSLSITCKCGEKYSTDFNSFKNYNQIRCRKCTNQMSKGEILIEKYLVTNKIHHDKQVKFDDLKAKNGNHHLKFDFGIFDVNGNLLSLIEFDGKQHYVPVDYYGGIDAFNILKMNDDSKNSYCMKNEIKLVRIPYYKIDEIEIILTEHIYPKTISCQSQLSYCEIF